MGIIRACENLDPTLSITQVLTKDISDAALPEHDRLYLEKAKQVEDAEKVEEEGEAADSGSDNASDETPDTNEEATDTDGGNDTPEDAETEESDMEVIDGKLTTVATESLRTEDHYSRFAVESFGEETLLQKTGSMAWNGVKALSGYALHIATELAVYMKELGVEYGPKVYAKLRSGVSYLLTRLFKSFVKMRSAVSRAYFQHTHSFKKHSNRLQRLRSILDGLPDSVKVMQPEPFQDEAVAALFTVGSEISPMKSISAMDKLLDVVVGDIDQGIHNEIGTMQRVIEVCQRNTRVEVVHYLETHALSSGFMRKTVLGYDKAPELVETTVFVHPLPMKTILMAAMPRKDIIMAAARSDDMSEVSKAYQESYLVLGVNPQAPKTSSMVNYMDKQSLLRLLNGLEMVVNKASSHVSFYKKLELAAERLKPNFQNYFSWLTEDAQAKNLRESLVEVIYLKQSFITKVYLPGAIDIHDFSSDYVSGVLRYVEKNIEVLKPTTP